MSDTQTTERDGATPAAIPRQPAWWQDRRRGRVATLLVAILLLGNIAMAAYVLIELRRLPPGSTASALFTRKPRA